MERENTQMKSKSLPRLSDLKHFQILIPLTEKYSVFILSFDMIFSTLRDD